MKKVNELLNNIIYDKLDDEGENMLDSFIAYKEGSISDILREIAETEIDIYNADLLKWLGDNYGFFEEYINNNGIGKDFRLFETIMGCQFEYLSFNIGSDLMLGYAYKYILNELETDEISETQGDSIEKLVKELDSLELFRKEIKKLIKGEN
jgi:hypothetical protein